MTGGIDPTDPTNHKDQSQSGPMIWFQTTFSTFLIKPWVKVAVILLFILYLAVSCYGITTLNKGLAIKKMYPPKSPMYVFYNKEEQYFQNYPYRVQVFQFTSLKSMYIIYLHAKLLYPEKINSGPNYNTIGLFQQNRAKSNQ